MSKGNSAAPQAPDFSGLINAATQQSRDYAGIMRDQLQWAKDQYGQNRPYYQQAMQQDLDAQKSQNEFASQQRARYNELYAPLQQQFVGAVKDYNSPTEVARARGQAMGSVAEQYGAVRDAATRQLQSYGVDPSSARFGALDIGTRTSEAAAAAAAGTQSDVNRENTSLGLQAQALNIGNGLPASATASNAGGTGAGGGAVNAVTNSYSPYAGALGNPIGFGNLSTGALGLAGNFTNMGYQNQLSQFNANQNSSSGFGSLLGIGAGVGMRLAGFAKGGRVPSLTGEYPPPAARGSVPTQSAPLHPPRGMNRLSNIPTHMTYAGGGAVPMAGQQVPASMSPSGGARTDDVPAQVTQTPGGPPRGEAAINVDEFIMPKDVANWIGGKQLQNMVIKARKEMASGQQAPAQPTPAGAPNAGAVPAGGGSYAGGGAVGMGPSPRMPMPHMSAAPRMPVPGVSAGAPAAPRAPRPAGNTRHPGYVSPGAGGGAGKGPAINLGGHQPPRPTNSMYGSPAGSVRSAVPGV